MESSHSSPKKKSKKEKKRHHSKADKHSGIKDEDTKRIKFEEKPVVKAKCLTFPPKYDHELNIQVSEPDTARDPVVVSFPSGLPSSLALGVENEHSEELNNTSLPIFKWTKMRETISRGRILRGVDNTCNYNASNDGRGYDGRMTKFYIGIYHKPTNTVSFLPSSERGTVFAMDQSVTSYIDTKGIDIRNLTASQRRRMVFESFGSSKKKKVLRSQDANVVEMRSVVGAGEGMMKALGMQMEGNGVISESNKKVIENMRLGTDYENSTAIDKAFQEARRGFLPPFDENAEHPFQVYDSQEVAGDDAWAQISRVVDACINKEDWKMSFQKYPWPKSTALLLDLVVNPQKKSSKYQLKTILLVNHLVKFHNKASKKFIDGNQEDVAKAFGLPKPISDRFLELFSAPSYDRGNAGFAVSKQHKDKRVLFTLIMYLLAHGKEMKCGSIDQLCKDMQLETKDAILLFREAGCKCSKNKSGMVSVSLSVPLTFPPPKRGKKT